MNVLGIDVAIKKSKRRTVSIFIERDGTISARVPKSLSSEEISSIIKSKEYQIHKHLAEWNQLNEKKVEREYVNGQSFLYLGKNYRLSLVPEVTSELMLRNGRFLLSQENKDQAKRLFIEFYKSKLQERLPSIVSRYQSQMGVTPNELKVMELQHRWASCSPKGNINFHWKCAMAPIEVLHYIVVHELAHLIHPNHTVAFWNEVDKILPNYQLRHQWLKLNGAEMDL